MSAAIAPVLPAASAQFALVRLQLIKDAGVGRVRRDSRAHIDKIAFYAMQCVILAAFVQACTGESSPWLLQPHHARLHAIRQGNTVCGHQSGWVLASATHAVEQLPKHLHRRETLPP